MGLEKKLNKRLISFIIGGSIFKLTKKGELQSDQKNGSINKIKKFFNSGIKEIKKDINKMNNG